MELSGKKFSVCNVYHLLYRVLPAGFLGTTDTFIDLNWNFVTKGAVTNYSRRGSCPGVNSIYSQWHFLEETKFTGISSAENFGAQQVVGYVGW